MIDTHLHLDLLDADAVGAARVALVEAAHVGVTDVIAIGVDPRASSEARAPLTAVGLRVHHALGLHPQALRDRADLADALDALDARLRSERVVALGETGLDARAGMPDRALQEEAFRAQLALARAHDLPVVLHGVRRDGDMLRVLADDARAPGHLRGVWHGYSGARDTMRMAVERGLYVAVGGVVLNTHARRLRDAVPHIPEDRLLVETDAPPLAPARLVDVVAEVARLRGTTAEAIVATTTRNARALFQI